MRHYRIGETYPLETRRGILGQPLANPVWHPLKVRPLKELAAVGILKRLGVNAFVPTEDRTRTAHGRRTRYQHPTITQIIYARFAHVPHWDVMRARQIITGVYCVGSSPIILTPDAIRIIRGLPTRDEERRAALEELRRVNAGDRGVLITGPFAGLAVDVTRSADGRVWWQAVLATGLPITGEVARGDVDKLGDDANP